MGGISPSLEIIRVLNVHRRMTGSKREAIRYSIERNEGQRAAERVGQYGIKRAESPAGVLQKTIERLERLIQHGKRSRPMTSQQAMQALERACRELRQGAIGSS